MAIKDIREQFSPARPATTLGRFRQPTSPKSGVCSIAKQGLFVVRRRVNRAGSAGHRGAHFIVRVSIRAS